MAPFVYPSLKYPPTVLPRVDRLRALWLLFVARTSYQAIACAEPAFDRSHALRLIIFVRTSQPAIVCADPNYRWLIIKSATSNSRPCRSYLHHGTDNYRVTTDCDSSRRPIARHPVDYRHSHFVSSCYLCHAQISIDRAHANSHFVPTV
jgi:hypothetical protein